MPLTITVPGREFYDQRTGSFINVPETTLRLEHSLYGIRLWESKWKVPFLDDVHEKTREQMRDYVRFMTLTKNVNPLVYFALTNENLKQIEEYINDPATAATFKELPGQHYGNGKFISAETIYFQMFQNNIPLECEKWNFNSLRALVEYSNRESAPKKKLSKDENIARMRALKQRRRGKRR